jgi:hypothetical protein
VQGKLSEGDGPKQPIPGQVDELRVAEFLRKNLNCDFVGQYLSSNPVKHKSEEKLKRLTEMATLLPFPTPPEESLLQTFEALVQTEENTFSKILQTMGNSLKFLASISLFPTSPSMPVDLCNSLTFEKTDGNLLFAFKPTRADSTGKVATLSVDFSKSQICGSFSNTRTSHGVQPSSNSPLQFLLWILHFTTKALQFCTQVKLEVKKFSLHHFLCKVKSKVLWHFSRWQTWGLELATSILTSSVDAISSREAAPCRGAVRRYRGKLSATLEASARASSGDIICPQPSSWPRWWSCKCVRLSKENFVVRSGGRRRTKRLRRPKRRNGRVMLLLL